MSEVSEIDDEAWQAAKDAIVDGVLNEMPPEDFSDAIEVFDKGLWERGGITEDDSYIDLGVWLQNHKVPAGFDLLQYSGADEKIEETRLSELENGASPTKDEYVAFLRMWLINNSEEADGDVFPSFCLYPITHTDGRQCYFLGMITGDALSGVDEWIEGYFQDLTASQAYLRASGSISYDLDNEEAVQRFINEHLPKSAELPNTTDIEQLRLAWGREPLDDETSVVGSMTAEEAFSRVMRMKFDADDKVTEGEDAPPENEDDNA